MGTLPGGNNMRQVKILGMAGALLLCAAVVYAQSLPGLGELPPDVQAKMARLAQILSEKMHSGAITEQQVQAEVNSGNPTAMIQRLGPEATALLQDITESLKTHYSPEQLEAILGALSGVK